MLILYKYKRLKVIYLPATILGEFKISVNGNYNPLPLPLSSLHSNHCLMQKKRKLSHRRHRTQIKRHYWQQYVITFAHKVIENFFRQCYIKKGSATTPLHTQIEYVLLGHCCCCCVRVLIVFKIDDALYSPLNVVIIATKQATTATTTINNNNPSSGIVWRITKK